MRLSSFAETLKNVFEKRPRQARTNDLIYAVGDVHGRQDLLALLLADIRTDIETQKRQEFENVTVVFLGDYIDRGHASNTVLDTLISLEMESTKIIYLKGNHEAAMLNFIDGVEGAWSWVKFGGRETLSSYGIELGTRLEAVKDWETVRQSLIKELPADHLNFLRQLKSYKIEGQYMFVHAGVHPDKPVEHQTDEDYLWIRNTFLHSMKKLPYIIVHGHTPETNPVWDGRRIGIDTGAYMSNKLTAVRLLNGEVRFLST